MQKQPLCRLCVPGGFWKSVRARQGLCCLKYQVAGMEWLPTGSPHAYSDALSFLLCFVLGQKVLLAGNAAVNLQAGQSTPIECLHPKKVEDKQWCSSTDSSWSREFLQHPEVSHGSPTFSILSFSLVCCADAVHLALSCLTGVIALCVYI